MFLPTGSVLFDQVDVLQIWIQPQHKKTIRIFDVLRSDKPCVNELMGHCGPVLDVCWNFEETLMGSCDSTGTVILWKRVKITKPEENEEE